MDAPFSTKTFSRRLERAYMHAHRRDRNTVLGFLIAQTLLAFFVAYLLDRFTGFPALIRLAVTLGILGGVLGWQLFRNLDVLRRKKDPESMARDVERRAKGIRPGGLYSMLVSATEFGVLGRTPGSEELRQRVLTQAGDAEYDPTKLELHRREDAVRTRKWLLATLAVYVLWGVVGPASMAVFFARAVGLPAAYPTRTRIDVIDVPETVARFQDVTFTVTGSGELPARGTVEIQYDGSKSFDLALEPVVDSPGMYAALLERPQRDFDYRIRLGDAESRSRSLRVITPPVVGSGTLTVFPPEYTDRSPRTRPLGSFEVWEGGTFSLEISVAEKAEHAELILGDRALKMEPTAEGFEISSVSAESTTPYSIRLVGEDGVENPRRAEFRLTVRKDEPPQVTLLSPDEGASLAPRSLLRWAFTATDDLGLTKALLQAKVIRPEVLGSEGEVLEEAETLATNEVDLADLQGATDLELDGSLIAESLGAKPGTRLELRVRVHDRYPQRDTQEGWSNPVTLQVVTGQKLKEILAEELMGAHLMIQDIQDDMKRQRRAVEIRQDMTL